MVQDSFHAEDGKEPDHEQRVGQWKHRVVVAAQRLRKRLPRLFQLTAGVIEHVHNRNAARIPPAKAYAMSTLTWDSCDTFGGAISHQSEQKQNHDGHKHGTHMVAALPSAGAEPVQVRASLLAGLQRGQLLGNQTAANLCA